MSAKKTVNKIGGIVLAVGIAVLLTGIVFAFAVGTIAVPILLSSSIVINALGITLLRWKSE